jgi:hypothetical protein
MDRTSGRPGRARWALGATAAIVLAASAVMAWPSAAAPPRVVAASSVAELARALGQAQPGDRIQVADGVYSSGVVRVTRSGTAAAPITIAATHLGKAELRGAARLELAGASHVVIEGFRFGQDEGLTVPVGATAVRISRNVFDLKKSGNWVTVSGDDTEVDHNTFQHKRNAGVYLQISGPGSHGMAQRVHIHHNYFFDHQFKGSNGGESLRLGLSGRQHGQAHALVELNLFEKADGDSEAISVKSSDNTVRYNTFRNSRGTLSLRHGNRTVVDGNFLIGGSSGIRFFGNDHVVINNVVQNTSGQPLEVGGGEIRDDTNSTTAHEAADRCLVAFNTLSGTRGDMIKFGGGKKYAPDTITLADNILVGSGQLVRVSLGTHLTWQGNIVSGGSAGAIPSGGYRSVNPGLVQGPGGLVRLAAGSPAIGAAAGSFPQVTRDMDDQARTDAKDVGADEYLASGVIHQPLTSADVGPQAP